MFTTERLRLRAFRSSDFEHVLALHNDPNVAPWMAVESYCTPVTEDAFREGPMAFLQKSLMLCIVEEPESNDFVGITILFQPAAQHYKNPSFGISLGSKYQNKGYGTEITQFMVDYAFRNLGMHRVSLAVVGGNERAVQVYKKIGFMEEARIRKYVWLDGAWQDRLKMGILYEEWNAQQSG